MNQILPTLSHIFHKMYCYMLAILITKQMACLIYQITLHLGVYFPTSPLYFISSKIPCSVNLPPLSEQEDSHHMIESTVYEYTGRSQNILPDSYLICVHVYFTR